MGDAASVRLDIAEESTFGTAPTPGAGVYRTMRFTSETLKHAQATVQSAEIDPTRQPSGTDRVSVSAEGQINYELSLVTPAASPGNGFDLLMELALSNDWSAVTTLTTQTIDIENLAAGQFDLDDTHVSDDAFLNVEVGQGLKLSGFSTNGTVYARVVAKTNDGLVTCEGVRATGAAVTAEVGANITVAHSTLKIGNTKKSATIQRAYLDLVTPEYGLFTGMRCGTWDLRVSPQGILGGSFGFLGKLVDTTTSNGAGTPDAKWATQRLNAVDHVKLKMEGTFQSVATALRISEFSFRLDNRLRTEPEVGVLGSTDIGLGTPTLTGTLNAYMSNADMERKLEDFSDSKLAFLLTDGTRDLWISIPRIKFTDGTVNAQGNDQSVIAQLQWAAEPDANGVAFRLDRF